MKEKNITNLMLEQYILKELPVKKIREMDVIRKQRPDIFKKIEEIKMSNADILNKYPAALISESIKHASRNSNGNLLKIQDRKKRKKISMCLALSSAGLVAASVLFFSLPAVQTKLYNVSGSVPGTDRVKGNNSVLYIYRKNNNSIDDLHSGSIAGKGDLLQIAYLSVKDKYGIILSIDGRGVVTLHYPPQNNDSTELLTGRKVPLANSYQLDDAPGFERFFLITSGSSLNVNEVMNAAKSISMDREKMLDESVRLIDKADGQVNQVSVIIIKESSK